MFPFSFGIARETLPNAGAWASVFCTSARFMRAMLAKSLNQVHDPIGYPDTQTDGAFAYPLGVSTDNLPPVTPVFMSPLSVTKNGRMQMAPSRGHLG
jgi:hypothetical protein